MPHASASVSLVCDISTGTPQPFVPNVFCHTVFNSLYSLSLPGVKATIQLISDCFVWPNMDTNIKAWTRCRIPCQHAKIHRHTVTPLSTFPTQDARFRQIHLDIVGPLPPFQGFSYLLTCIDRFSCWSETFPMADIIAETVARTFVHGWVAIFGVPSTITTAEDANSKANCGKFSRICSVTLTYAPLRTIQLQTGWLNSSIVSSKPRSRPGTLPNTGWMPYLLSSSVSTELSKRICIWLPGEFFKKDHAKVSSDLAPFLIHLRTTMCQLKALPPCTHPPRNSYTHKDLDSCTHVFVYNDSVRQSLRAPMMAPTESLSELTSSTPWSSQVVKTVSHSTTSNQYTSR